MSDKKIPLVEAFGPTIQGEGAMIGVQTYFLRFGLCDYKCKMCDSMHAVDPGEVKKRAKWLTQEEILQELLSLAFKYDETGGPDWVTLSGGNPCIHDLMHLVSRLHDYDFKVAVETQGTMWQDWVNDCDHVTISPKAPGMGEDLEWNKLDSFMDSSKDMYHYERTRCLKMPVFHQLDLEVARTVHEKYPHVDFYLSMGNPYPPNIEGISQMPTEELLPILTNRYKELLEDIYQDPILSKVKFLPQWHLYLWGQDKGR